MCLFCRLTQSSDCYEGQILDFEVFCYLTGVVALGGAFLDGAQNLDLLRHDPTLFGGLLEGLAHSSHGATQF